MKFTSLNHDGYPSIVGSIRDKDKPVYRWHSYKHSYSKELVDNFIGEFGLTSKSLVLDPFVGGGTTLLACKEKNIRSIGLDISPFSVFLTKTKLHNYNVNKLKSTLEILQFQIENDISVKDYVFPDIPLLRKAFRQEVWNEILQIKDKILALKSKKYRDFFLLALLSILENVSNTKKAGGFLRITNKRIRKGVVRKRFYDYALFMINDVSNFREIKNKTFVKVHLGDARDLKINEKFDAVITSPPYPNRHDYTRIYSLELALAFIENNAELKKLRYKTLRSHVEAKRKYYTNGYIKPRGLDSVILRVESNGTNNPQVTKMIEGYFEDMYICLKEMKRVLNKNAKIALVVSNVRFSGVNIFVDELLGKVGQQAGLQLQEIRVARLRGNSSQQMRDYKKSVSRESIIIWKN